jgi:hypothetical protein
MKTLRQRERIWSACLLSLVVLVLAACLYSCAALGIGGATGDVLVERKYVAPNAPVIETTIAVKGLDGKDTGDTYVIAQPESVMPDSPTISLDEVPGSPLESPGVWNAITGMLGGTPLGPFAPLVGWLAVKLFAKRPRENVASAFRSLGHGDLKGAIYDLAAVEGIKHSDPTPANPQV